jgi:hypothetical protein
MGRPYDKDNDHQRINPGLAIVDADQRVFFDPDAKLYDKSDAGSRSSSPPRAAMRSRRRTRTQ